MVLGGPCEGVVGLHVGNRCSKVCLGSALGELFTLSVELLTLEDFFFFAWSVSYFHPIQSFSNSYYIHFRQAFYCWISLLSWGSGILQTRQDSSSYCVPKPHLLSVCAPALFLTKGRDEICYLPFPKKAVYKSPHLLLLLMWAPRLICLLLFRVPALRATPTCLRTWSPWVVWFLTCLLSSSFRHELLLPIVIVDFLCHF